MIRRIALVALLAIAVAHAQEGVRGEQTPAPEKPKETVALYLRFPVGRLFEYVYTDTTTVHRIYSDSSTLDYTRTVTYYLSLEAIEGPRLSLIHI